VIRGYGTYRAEHVEEITRNLFALRCRRHCENTERKGKTPPSHIEWELTAADTRNRKEL
jgi:hypothetical protein